MNNKQKSYLRHLPYTRAKKFILSDLSSALYDHLTIELDLSTEQLVEAAFLTLASKHLNKNAIAEIVESTNDIQYECIRYCEIRQVALFEYVLNEKQIASIHEEAQRHKTNSALQLVEDPQTLQSLDEISTILTKKYYQLNGGQLPSEFEFVEGYYLQSIGCGETVYCDADASHFRQVSFLLNISNNAIEFIPVSKDPYVPFSIKPGDCILYPSNFSCSYRLKGVKDSVSLLKFYRQDAVR